MRIFLAFLKTYSRRLGISEQLNYMHMPDFLLAVFVSLERTILEGYKEEKGGGEKASHTHPQLLAEREQKVNLNISSKFHTLIQKVGNQ